MFACGIKLTENILQSKSSHTLSLGLTAIAGTTGGYVSVAHIKFLAPPPCILDILAMSTTKTLFQPL